LYRFNFLYIYVIFFINCVAYTEFVIRGTKMTFFCSTRSPLSSLPSLSYETTLRFVCSLMNVNNISFSSHVHAIHTNSQVFLPLESKPKFRFSSRRRQPPLKVGGQDHYVEQPQVDHRAHAPHHDVPRRTGEAGRKVPHAGQAEQRLPQGVPHLPIENSSQAKQDAPKKG
jgi:hypothetical protein